MCFHEYVNFDETNLYIDETQAMQICETCFNILLIEEDSEKFDEKKLKKK